MFDITENVVCVWPEIIIPFRIIFSYFTGYLMMCNNFSNQIYSYTEFKVVTITSQFTCKELNYFKQHKTMYVYNERHKVAIEMRGKEDTVS